MGLQIPLHIGTGRFHEDFIEPCFPFKAKDLQFPDAGDDTAGRIVLQFARPVVGGKEYIVLEQVFLRPPGDINIIPLGAFMDDEDCNTIPIGVDGRLGQPLMRGADSDIHHPGIGGIFPGRKRIGFYLPVADLEDSLEPDRAFAVSSAGHPDISGFGRFHSPMILLSKIRNSANNRSAMALELKVGE